MEEGNTSNCHQRHLDRMNEIERENRILYEKLLTIHTKLKQPNNSNGNTFTMIMS